MEVDSEIYHLLRENLLFFFTVSRRPLYTADIILILILSSIVFQCFNGTLIMVLLILLSLFQWNNSTITVYTVYISSYISPFLEIDRWTSWPASIRWASSSRVKCWWLTWRIQTGSASCHLAPWRSREISIRFFIETSKDLWSWPESGSMIWSMCSFGLTVSWLMLKKLKYKQNKTLPSGYD